MTGKDIIDLMNILEVSKDSLAAFLHTSRHTLDRWTVGTLRPNYGTTTVLLLRSLCLMFLPAPRGRGLDCALFKGFVQNAGGYSQVFEDLYVQAITENPKAESKGGSK